MRVAVYVLCPLLITLFCILTFNSIVHCYQKDELEQARIALRQAEKKIKMKEYKAEQKAQRKEEKAQKRAEKIEAKEKAKAEKANQQFQSIDASADSPMPQP